MNHVPEIFAVSAALTFAVVWLVGTYRSRCMADPTDRPLSDTRDEWNTKR